MVKMSCEDGSIDIWDLNTFRKVKSFKAHDDWIPYLLFVDNSKLISCSADKIIKIWSSMTFECLIQLENHSDEVYCLDLTSDRRLISCSLDKTIKLWQTETGTMLESIDFQEKIYYFKILNEDLISVALDNGEIEIFNLNTMETIKKMSSINMSPVYSFQMLSNGYLAGGSQNGEINLWKIFE